MEEKTDETLVVASPAAHQKPRVNSNGMREMLSRVFRYQRNSLYRRRLKGTFLQEYHLSSHARQTIDAPCYEQGSVWVRPNPSHGTIELVDVSQIAEGSLSISERKIVKMRPFHDTFSALKTVRAFTQTRIQYIMCTRYSERIRAVERNVHALILTEKKFSAEKITSFHVAFVRIPFSIREFKFAQV